MMIKKYIYLVMIIAMSCKINAQTNMNKNNFIFRIGEFTISPAEKIVYGKKMTGGTDYDSDGNAISHWHGYEYVPAKEINFNKTSLIFLGNFISFLEFFPIKVDPASLRVIFYSIGYDNNYTYVLSPLEKKVYQIGDFLLGSINVENYIHVNNLLFKNNQGKLFFIPFGTSNLVEITIPVDEASLKHVVDNYYTDKNGLYYFNNYGIAPEILEKSKGREIKPTLYENYFTYGDSAYPYGQTTNRKEIKLDATRLKKIRTSYNSYLGDGDKLFILPVSTTRHISSTITPKDFIQNNTPIEPISEWQYIDIITVGGNLFDKTLYFSSPQTYAGSGTPHTLIKTKDNFYGIRGSSMTLEAVKFNNILIYNFDKEAYESIELDKYKRITGHFYIYKDRMYYTDSYPVETQVDINKLQPLTHHGKETQFYTDGRYLLGGYNLGKLETEQRGKHKWYKLINLFEDVDWATLQIVNEETLIDKNYIYQTGSSVIHITPIKEIGINVLTIKFKMDFD